MHSWSFDPLEAARCLAGPPGDEPSWRAVDFAGTASWVVDGMHYLHDLDPFNLPDDRVSMRHGTVLHEFSPTLRGSRVEVGALPVIAREFATRHVEAFLRRALCGALSPTTP